jgi:hypothetical protein
MWFHHKFLMCVIISYSNVLIVFGYVNRLRGLLTWADCMPNNRNVAHKRMLIMTVDTTIIGNENKEYY